VWRSSAGIAVARLRKERVERYHKIHELHAKKAEIATIAHQMGLSRQAVYNYLKMEQPKDTDAYQSAAETAH
jgi:predicted transcriptional regulator